MTYRRRSYPTGGRVSMILQNLEAAGVCDNQVLPDRSQTVDSKSGEMSEWLKEHAWKAIPASCIE